MIGYAFCGSFCTLSKSVAALEDLAARGYEIQSFMSQAVYELDTRFGSASERREKVEKATARPIVHTLQDAEPFGPAKPLDLLIVAPCTGNTLAKIAAGITDTPVTMAVKAHLRRDRPLLIALSTNDAMSQNLANIAALLTRKSVYFLPMKQDDPEKKPYSLVADLTRMPEAVTAAMEGRQLRPLFL